LDKKVKSYLKNNQSKNGKMAGGVVQPIEHLSSKKETLSSNPSTVKKSGEEEEEQEEEERRRR
jgi:hypothetical protein